MATPFKALLKPWLSTHAVLVLNVTGIAAPQSSAPVRVNA